MNLFKKFRPTTAHFRWASGIPAVAPRLFPTTGFTTIPASEKIEEENWAWYTPKFFYPVHIGDVVHSKYQVLYKLVMELPLPFGCAGIFSQFLCSSP